MNFSSQFEPNERDIYMNEMARIFFANKEEKKVHNSISIAS